MKLLNNIFSLLFLSAFLSAQVKGLDLKYEKALKLTNADDALKIYDEIINSNQESDFVWLSKLKKAEMFYAKGSYISASTILKDFNLNAPYNLQNKSSKDLLFKSLNAVGQTDSLKFYQRLLSSKKNNQYKSKFLKKNKIWFIQFGAFSSMKNAQMLKDALIKDNIRDIQIDQVFKNGSMLYYVRSSHFNSYEKAVNQSKKIENNRNFTISGF